MSRKKLNRVLDKASIKITDGARAYSQLRQEVIKAGILERDYSYYILHITSSVALLAFFVYKLLTASEAHLIILWSMLVAFFAVQVSAGNVHEGGHRAVFKKTLYNDLLGLIASFPFGMGYSYWKVKHNQHHAHPNEEEEDPDVDLPILAFTKERFDAKKGLSRFLSKYQVFLYYPIGLLVFISLRVQSLKFYFRNFSWKLTPEIIFFLIGNVLWFGFPFLFFPFWTALAVVLLINFATGFYLFNIFAPNHKGMPHLKKGTKISFLEQQVMTSRNIYGHWLTDYVYLGLNYQIEHHLFPNCPRSKLKLIKPHLLSVCKKLRLEYTQVSPFQQNQIILGELHRIAASN